MRRLFLVSLGWIVLAAGVATLMMWALAIVAMAANALGADILFSLGGIARGTMVFTAGIVFVLLIARHTSLLTWRCELRP